jgi:translation initiation factor 1
MNRREDNSRLVYSSDSGRVKYDPKIDPTGTRRLETLRPQTSKAPTGPVLPDDGIVRIFREKGGKGGKTVTAVHGLPKTGVDLQSLATELKRSCGAGGTLKDGVVEIQGDHREKVAEKLRAMGYQVKLAGG